MIVPKDAVYNKRFTYFGDLLNLVLSRSGRAYQLKPREIAPSPTVRNVMYMQQGKFDVIPMHTNAEREKRLRPIRFPIYRGLIGWRLFIINKKMQSPFSELTTRQQLKRLKAGQVYDWPDTHILTGEQFTVRTSKDWTGVLNLLYHGRIDYFPRGIPEVWEEIDKLDNNLIPVKSRPQFAVEERLVLHYPSAFYMFVNKENEALAQALEAGFEKAVADGSFKQLLMNYVGPSINRSNLANRRVISIPNKGLSKETPLDRKALWFTLEELKQGFTPKTDSE